MPHPSLKKCFWVPWHVTPRTPTPNWEERVLTVSLTHCNMGVLMQYYDTYVARTKLAEKVGSDLILNDLK